MKYSRNPAYFCTVFTRSIPSQKVLPKNELNGSYVDGTVIDSFCDEL